MSSEISLENEKSDRNTVQKSFFSWDNLRERHLSPREETYDQPINDSF